MPENVAVPLPLSIKVTPGGSKPLWVTLASGVPVVVTVKDPAVPTVKVAEAPLVKAGASVTPSENCCVTDPAALEAVNTRA